MVLAKVARARGRADYESSHDKTRTHIVIVRAHHSGRWMGVFPHVDVGRDEGARVDGTTSTQLVGG